MMSVQVLLQRNHIPLRNRIPVLVRYYGRLRELAEPPTDGQRFHTVRFRRAAARTSSPDGW